MAICSTRPVHATVPPGRLHLRDAAALAAVYLLAVAYPLTPLSSCPIATHLHAPCPGCGSTRSILALLHGRFVESLHHNAIAPLIVAGIGLFALRSLAIAATQGFSAVGRDRVALAIAKGLAALWVVQLLLYVARFAGLFGGPEPV
jgi:hypothetical protein